MTSTETEPTVVGTTERRRPMAEAVRPLERVRQTWLPWAPVPLRLMLGFGFMYHGAPKLFTVEGHQQFTGLLQSLGIPLPELMSWVVGLVETVGGLALILGAFVVLASSLLVVNMIVAMVTVHLPNGFSFINQIGATEQGPQFGMPGYEVNLLYIAGLLALILGGAGAGSLDGPIRRAFGPRRRQPALRT